MLRRLGPIGAVAAAYYVLARLGLLVAVAHPVVSSAWPPTGVALSVLLLFGLRLWPGIALGAFLLNWTSGVPMAGAAAIAGQTEQAEQILRDVVNRATQHQRPLLAAVAQRDLAYLLQRKGQERMAKDLALTARSAFDRLGATVEIEKLDVLVGDAE